MHVKVLSVAAAAALTAAGVAAGGTSATADSSTVVGVVGGTNHLRVSRSSAAAGRISFDVSTTAADSQVEMVKPLGSATLADLGTYLGEEFSPDPATAAQGTRDLETHFRFVGLSEVTPGHATRVTEYLDAGQYYLLDSSRRSPVPSSFTVTGRLNRDGLGDVSARVVMTSSDRFLVSGQLPARGSIEVRNASDTIHFMELIPVKAGTTDAQIQRFLASGNPGRPPFLRSGPNGGTSVMSPGVSLKLTYDLPAGTYAMLCFVADDMTGMPHAVMGMHQVVVLH